MKSKFARVRLPRLTFCRRTESPPSTWKTTSAPDVLSFESIESYPMMPVIARRLITSRVTSKSVTVSFPNVAL